MHSPHAGVRQLAAVELRKRIRKWWTSLPATLKDDLRTQLLHAARDEKDAKTRHSIIQVVSSITYNEPWPGLASFLYQACQSPKEEHREMALYCVYTVFEHMPDYFMSPELLPMLQKALGDPSQQIRVTAVLVLGKLAEYKDSEHLGTNQVLDTLVPPMLHVLQQVVLANRAENLPTLFEVFDTLVMLNTPLLTQHLSLLVNVFIDFSSNTEIQNDIRLLALSVLTTLTHFQSKKLKKLDLLEPLIDRLMLIGTEECPEDPEEEAPSRLAFKVIEGIALGATQTVFLSLMSYIVHYLHHPEPGYRRSGLWAMAAMTEGCAESMADESDQLFSFVHLALKDHDLSVRRAAAATLSCLILDMELTEPESLLEPVLDLANDPCLETTKNMCCVLDRIVETLGPRLEHHLPRIVDTLWLLLHRDKSPAVIAAIGCTAHAAGHAFEPHAPRLLPVLIEAMASEDPTEDYLLRGVATDALGLMADAAPIAFATHTHTVMRLGLEQLYLHSVRLREYTFAMVINLGRQHDLSPYLEDLVPELLLTCRADDAAMDMFEHCDYVEAEEEALAVETLGELLAYAPLAFLPFLDQAQAELIRCLGHPLQNVRLAATLSLLSWIKTAYRLSEPGLSLPDLIHTLMPTLVDFWKEEEERSVVERVSEAITAALDLVGPPLVAPCLPAICSHLLEIYQGQANCQQCDDEEEWEEDFSLLGYASNLLTALCQLGPDFSSHFGLLLPALLTHTDPGQVYRSALLGCLGECIIGIQAGISPYTQTLLPLFVQGCLDSRDEAIQSNSAFALGSLVYHTTLDLTMHYFQFLNALSPLFHHSLPETADNAAGAIARLILAHPASVPLDQVLPVWVQALPLKVDFEENEPVFDCLFELFNSFNPWVYQQLQPLLPVFLHVLSYKDNISQHTRMRLIKLIQSLCQRPDLHFDPSPFAPFLSEK